MGVCSCLRSAMQSQPPWLWLGLALVMAGLGLAVWSLAPVPAVQRPRYWAASPILPPLTALTPALTRVAPPNWAPRARAIPQQHTVLMERPDGAGATSPPALPHMAPIPCSMGGWLAAAVVLAMAAAVSIACGRAFCPGATYPRPCRQGSHWSESWAMAAGEGGVSPTSGSTSGQGGPPNGIPARRDEDFVHKAEQFVCDVDLTALLNADAVDGQPRFRAIVLPPLKRELFRDDPWSTVEEKIPDISQSRLAHAVGPPFYNPQSIKRKAREKTSSPPQPLAPEGWGIKERREWTTLVYLLHVGPSYVLHKFAEHYPQSNIFMVLPDAVGLSGELLNLYYHQTFSQSSPSSGLVRLLLSPSRLAKLKPSVRDEAIGTAVELAAVFSTLVVDLVERGYASAVDRWVKFACASAPHMPDLTYTPEAPFPTCTASSLPASEHSFEGAAVVYPVILQHGKVPDREALLEELTLALVSLSVSGCRSFALIGLDLHSCAEGDLSSMQAEAKEALDEIFATAAEAARRIGAFSNVVLDQIQKMEAREPPSRDEAFVMLAATRLAQAPSLAHPLVASVLQRHDIAVALSCVPRIAAHTPDITEWRAALPHWEETQRQAQAAGCPEDSVLWVAVEKVVANARMAVALADRLQEALASVPSDCDTAMTAPQLKAFEEVLADMQGAEPPIGRALQALMTASAPALDRAAQQQKLALQRQQRNEAAIDHVLQAVTALEVRASLPFPTTTSSLPLSKGVLKGRDFFLLRTPLKDRP